MTEAYHRYWYAMLNLVVVLAIVVSISECKFQYYNNNLVVVSFAISANTFLCDAGILHHSEYSTQNDHCR